MHRFGIPHNADHKKLSRSELYELVWSQPLRTIAPRFGLSDVGLRKACTRAEIPVPPVGYWEKVRHRKRLGRRPTLPTSSLAADADVYLVASGRRAEDLAIEMPDDIAATIADVEKSPVVMPQRVQLHPLIAHDQATSTGGASKNDVRRRRIMSVMFREIEEHGGSIVRGERAPFKLRWMSEELEISLAEPSKQVKVPLTSQERSWGWGRERDWKPGLEPSGILSFRIEEYFDKPIRRQWRDRPDNPLENQLQPIIIGILSACAHERRKRLRLQAAEQQRRLEEQRRWELEERRRREKEETDRLIGDARAWDTARLIRAYVCERHNAMIAGPESENAEPWAKWANGVADRLDPLIPAK